MFRRTNHVLSLLTGNIFEVNTINEINGGATGVTIDGVLLKDGLVGETYLPDASTTAQGVAELATTAETTAGTDTGRVVTPDGLAGSIFGTKSFSVLVSDPNGDALTTGDSKVAILIPPELNGMDLVSVGAGVTTVSSSGIPTVQLRRNRRASATTRTDADMLSTKLTVDASEFSSVDAAAAAVINTSNDDVQTGDQIHIDVDVAGTGVKGLTVALSFRLP
jgi:hypothetical protein